MEQPAWSLAVPAFLVALLASAAATRGVLGWLRHKQILDHPNERSSHSHPTPRGGGLAVTPVAAIALALAGQGWLAAGALALMALSWIDDRKGLPALPRFLTHAGVVAAGLVLVLPSDALVFGGLLPWWADRLLAGLGWLWFVNLYNFMDGIDGITGVETACLGLGIAVCAPGLETAGLALAGAGAGFLVWNWHPARIFLGDSGSVPLGFALGGLLLQLAANGGGGSSLAAALILPGYYGTDASITLLWRLKDGEKIWQAHRRHFYQRAVKGGQSHARVTLVILAANLALIACALAAVRGAAPAGSVAAVLVVAGLLAVMTRWARGGRTG